MAFDLSTAKPVGEGGFDLSTAKPVEAPTDIPGKTFKERPPTKDSAPKMGAHIGAMEAIGSIGSGGLLGFAGAAAGIPVTLAQKATGSSLGLPPGHELPSRWASAAYQPRSQEGKDIVAGAGKVIDATKIAGLGPTEGMMLQGAPRAAITSRSKSVPLKPADNVPKIEPGAGATKVTGELQRQRDVMEGKLNPNREAGASEYEKAATAFDDKIEPLKKEALGLTAKVDSAQTVALIDQLEAKNPDAKVRAALREVRATIERATESSGTANLPAAGARVTPAELKALQGQSGQLSIPMADEVRQSINRLIDAKGDGALDAYTQKVLGQVRDDLVGRTPQIYQRYLQQFAEGRKGLEQFNPEQGVIGKVTGTEPGYRPLQGDESQKAIEAAMTGKRSTRDMTDLVSSTKNNPEAAQGLRESFAQWITAADPVLGKAKAGDLLGKWDKVRSDAVRSGLMTAEHAAEVDAVAKGVRDAVKGGPIRKTVAYVVGSILPGPHPFMAAHRIEQSVDAITKTNTTQKMEAAIMRVAATPEGAKLLNAPPTPANIERVRAMLPQDIAAGIAVPAAQTNETRKKDVFSMDPPVLRGAPQSKSGSSAFVRG